MAAQLKQGFRVRLDEDPHVYEFSVQASRARDDMIGARHPAAGAASAACYTGRAAHTVVAPVVRCLKVTARRTYRNKSCCTHDHGLTAALLEPS